MIYRLRLPPSVNDIWAPVIVRKPGRKPVARLVSTKEASRFRRYAEGVFPKEPISGPVELFITFYVPTIASDCSNRIKALEDAMRGLLFFDDVQVAELHVCKVPTETDGPTGVVVEVKPADPVKHAELARRLAKSSTQRQANERAQSSLFAPTDGGAFIGGQHATAAGSDRVKPSDARGDGQQDLSPSRPRAALPEPLAAKLHRLARPAVVTNRPPDEPPEAA